MKSKYFAVVRDHKLCIRTPVYSEILVCDYYYKYYISAFFSIPIFFFMFFFIELETVPWIVSLIYPYSCLITSAIFHSLLNEVHSLLVLWCCFLPAGFLKCPFWCYLFVLSACGINLLLLIHLSLSLLFFSVFFSLLYFYACFFFTVFPIVKNRCLLGVLLLFCHRF